MTKLLCGRWTGDLPNGTPIHDLAFHHPESLGFRWRIGGEDNPLGGGGLIRMEATVRSFSKTDAYQRYNQHAGQRLIMYSSWSYGNIVGWITSVEPAGAGRVRYVAEGTFIRTSTEFINVTFDESGTDTITDAILQILASPSFRMDDGITTEIANNTTPLDSWQPPLLGVLPAVAMGELLRMSDSNNDVYTFLFRPNPFQPRIEAGLWRAVYSKIDKTAAPDWEIDITDMARSDTLVSRDIKERVTHARVYYGTINGAATNTQQNPFELRDQTANFIDDGVSDGDLITNIGNNPGDLDGSRGRVIDVDPQGRILTVGALTAGLRNSFIAGDAYSIRISDPSLLVEAFATDTDPWPVEVIKIESGMTLTQATQYANSLLDNDPLSVRPFTISSHHVRKPDGSKWPLWEMAVAGGGIIKINNLYPSSVRVLDRLTTFFITSLDYDNVSEQMRVTVDSADTRLDALLNQRGIIGSELIQRG